MKRPYIFNKILWLILILVAISSTSCSGGGSSGGGSSSTSYTLGGVVSGLNSGTQAMLFDSISKSRIAISSNGAFQFTNTLASGSNYNLVVLLQPTGEICSVVNGQGINVQENILDISVVCSTSSYSIGGTVSGLGTNQSVTLANNGDLRDLVTVKTNSSFSFVIPVALQGSYNVTIAQEPSGKTCTVNNAQGINVNQNITNITVVCSTSSYPIGGTLSGLTSNQSITLVDNGNLRNALVLNANGAFTFTDNIAFGGNYNVTAVITPGNEICSINNGQGVNINHNITNIAILCANKNNGYSIGGNVTGLSSGQNVVLVNNGDTKNPVQITADGSFTFSPMLAPGANYNVTVATQPLNETCTVNNGQGININNSVTNITVICSVDNYTIGGNVSGLLTGENITLVNNNDFSHPLVVTTNSNFIFSSGIAFQSNYNVTIATQPLNETCTVNNGQGVNINNNVMNITVTCSNDSYTIGGNVVGLSPEQNVTLINNGDWQNPIIVTKNGNFTFHGHIAYQGSYSVTVAVTPTNTTCSITNAQGVSVNQNIKNIIVTCSATDAYTIGGTVSGLLLGETVTLVNNGDWQNSIIVGASGAFTFATEVTPHSNYNVIIATQPKNEVCTANNGQGENVIGNITSITVVCSTDNYTIAGTVSGLSAGESVTLINNGNYNYPLLAAANESFTFTNHVAFQGSYNVTVATQAATYTCSVKNGYGTDVSSNITNVQVFCNKNVIPVNISVIGSIGTGFTLLNNHDHSDPLNIESLGNYTFSRKIPENGNFFITMHNEVNMFCSITPQQGNNIISTVNVVVNCFNVTSYPIQPQINGSSSNANLVWGSDKKLLYGTTSNGGAANYGTIFSFNPNTTKITALYNFGAKTNDGSNPSAALTLGNDGNLYGTTSYGGGTIGNGTVFRFNPTTQTESVVYSFGTNPNDGANPLAALTLGSDGNFYSTTARGGTNNNGTVFSFNPNTDIETVLYRFQGNIDAADPQAGLTLGYDGNFYGTTFLGGVNNSGAVFRFDPSNNTETVIHSFGTTLNDGSNPQAGLVQGYDGNFYGTTNTGGSINDSGVIFNFNPITDTETVLYAFSTNPNDGLNPSAALTLGNDGNFYETTSGGGINYAGVIFNFNPVTNQENIVYSFDTSFNDGSAPNASLVQGNDGIFYGTTSSGSTNNAGTIFKF